MEKKSAPDTGWCFALINGRLGEVYFEVGKGVKGIKGHCYVIRSEFKTKREYQMIDRGIRKYRLTYRNKFYTSQLDKK